MSPPLMREGPGDRYEALRAYLLDDVALTDVTNRFGYTPAALTTLVRDFRAGRGLFASSPGAGGGPVVGDPRTDRSRSGRGAVGPGRAVVCASLRRRLPGYATATPYTSQRRFLSTGCTITNDGESITVHLARRTYSPVLRAAGIPDVTIR